MSLLKEIERLGGLCFQENESVHGLEMSSPVEVHPGAPECVTPATQDASAEWGHGIQRSRTCYVSRVIGAPSTF